MALILADRVYEYSTTVGTGTLTLNGALASYQTFSTAIGNGNTCYYTISVSGGTDWEVGIGTVGAGTLARTTIISSSNSNLVVNLPVGTSNVFVTYPAEKSIHLVASGKANIGVSVLSDVTLATPLVNQVLGYNGTAWTNVEGNSASAGPGVVFYNATPSITAVSANNVVPILTLATLPVTTAEQTLSGTAVSNTVLFSSFISAALGRTLIDAGVWSFTTWIGVDSTAGSSTYLTRQVYTSIPFIASTVTTTGTGTSRTATASSGTPFATGVIDASATNTVASYLQTPQGLYQITARTSDTVVTIATPSAYANESAVAGTVLKKLFGVTTAPAITTISPAYEQFDLIVTAGQYTVTALTGIAILGFVTSDATRTITIPYNGTERNTHVNSPLANLHNDLNGLQGGSGTERYHSTLAEYTGTGTSGTPFVRQTSPTLITPALGVATATSINGLTVTASTGALTIASGKTLTSSNTLTLAGVDGKTLTTNNNLTLTGTDGITAAFGGGLAIAATKVLTSSNTLTLTGTDGITAAFGGGLAIAAAKVLTASNTLTFTGTDTSTVACGGGGTVAYTANNLSVFAATTSAQLAGVLSDETGSATGGLVVFNNAPTLINPITSAGSTTVPSMTLTQGTNLTTANILGAVESDSANALMYYTSAVATGRGLIPACQYYALAANAALQSTTSIIPFFPTAPNAINLKANAVYDIEIICYFTRSVAGTHLYTLTNTVVPAFMNVELLMSGIAGLNTTPTVSPLQGAIPGTTSAAAAFVATGSLAITTVHLHKFYIHIVAGTTDSNLRLNVTSPTAGFTPLAGSYWKCTRVANSVGTFAT